MTKRVKLIKSSSVSKVYCKTSMAPFIEKGAFGGEMKEIVQDSMEEPLPEVSLIDEMAVKN